MIDRPTIERIKDAADIVDVVSEFVSLRRVGSNYRGLCPFHNDHSPSFYVSPNRGTCKCFVCGEGGDSVGFVMKHEQLTYPEALRWLARRYNIEIREEQLTDDQRKEESEREGMFLSNEWVAKYYSDILHNDIDGRAIGMQYFRSRGFRDDIIERFKLGFSLSDRHAIARKAKEEGRNTDYLVMTGVCYTKDDKSVIDRFAGRAIFPWLGVSGKVVAFGGRVLDSRTKGVDQKYVNSPDSPIYHKDHELYGIFQAKRAIGKEDCVYMVEGYTDVIAMHQCGLENVVANSGTALSKHQIRLLHRFTSNIVLLYDGDAAGIKAALRGTDMLLQDGMNVKVLLLPDGDDPDSFSRKHNATEFKQYIEEHQTDFIEFKTRVLLQGVTDPIKRSEAINSIVKSVSVISDPIIRATYIKDCSSRLGIAEQTLITTMNNFIRSGREEQQREEEREQRRTQAQGNQQNWNSSVRIPQQTAAQGAQAIQGSQGAHGGQPVQGATSQPNTGGNPPYDDYEDFPPEAFLPPEAFEQPGGQTQQQSQATPKRPSMQVNDVQTLLVRAIIRYGERVIYDNIELEEGGVTTLNVAQYINYDMMSDSLIFSNPLYNQILAEAVEHSGDENFNATQYFIRHPDYEVSSLACNLAEDEVQLTKSMTKEYDQNTLRDHVLHLVLDMRKAFIDQKMSVLRTDIALASGDSARQSQLMAEYQQLQKVRNAFAKKLGANVF